MCFLRIAAILTALAAAPILVVSAESLAERARADARQTAATAAHDGSAAEKPRGVPAPVSIPPRIAPPVFSRILIKARGASSFEGRGTPGTDVSLAVDGREIGRVRTDASGRWRLVVGTPWPAGDHGVTIVATSADRAQAAAGEELRISIPGHFGGEAVVAYEAAAPPWSAAPAAVDPQRQRAEELAAAASRKFSEVVADTAPPAAAPYALPPAKSPGAPLPPAVQRTTQATLEKPAGELAPAAKPTSIPPAAQKPMSQAAEHDAAREPGVTAPLLDWLERSAAVYQDTIVKELSAPASGSGGGWRRVAQNSATGKPGEGGGVAQQWPGASWPDSVPGVLTDAQIAVQEWLARANRTYQTEIVRALQMPQAGGSAASASPSKGEATSTAAKAPAGKPQQAPAPKFAAPSEAVADSEKAVAEQPPKSTGTAAPVDRPEPPATDKANEAEAERQRAAREKSLEEQQARTKAEIAKTERERAEAEQKRADEARRKSEEAARLKAAEAQAKETLAKEALAKEAQVKETKTRESQIREAAVREAKRREEQRASERKKLEEEARAAEVRRQADRTAADAAARKAAAEADARRDAAAKEAAAEKARGDAAKSSVDLAQKAVDAARSGPARRAAEEARAAAKPKDDRIAEGSGETGPVDRPSPRRREDIDRTQRSGLGAGSAPGGAGAGGAAASGTAEPGGPASVHRGRVCPRAGRRITPPGTYVVKAGDTLSEIVELHYGTARRLARVVRANRRKIRDPDYIRPCQRIWLP